MDLVEVIVLIVAAVGAINWGLVGLAKIDLVAMIAGGLKFGDVNTISRVLYIVVGVCGLAALYFGLLGGNGA